jgi:hypothetical protein
VREERETESEMKGRRRSCDWSPDEIVISHLVDIPRTSTFTGHIDTHIHTLIHTYTHIHTHIHTHICIYIHAHMST